MGNSDLYARKDGRRFYLDKGKAKKKKMICRCFLIFQAFIDRMIKSKNGWLL